MLSTRRTCVCPAFVLYLHSLNRSQTSLGLPKYSHSCTVHRRPPASFVSLHWGLFQPLVSKASPRMYAALSLHTSQLSALCSHKKCSALLSCFQSPAGAVKHILNLHHRNWRRLRHPSRANFGYVFSSFAPSPLSYRFAH